VNVAVVGLGQMGAAVAGLLLERGHEVAVWNRSPAPRERLVAAGAVAADGYADVWRRAGCALTFLADDGAADAVLAADDGLLGAAPAGALVIELSTISPEASARVAATAEARGVRYVRSPVSGNPVVVRAGNLTAITSGPADALAAAAPYLDAFTARRFEVGDGEQARVVKLALNILIASTNQGLAEAIVLGEQHGVDRAALLEVVTGSAVASPFVGYKRGPLVQRDYTATFTMRNLAKDLRLTLDAAGAAGAEVLPMSARLAQIAEDAGDRGLADADISAVVALLQSHAGAEPDLPLDRPSPA
jgi:3-hydroxyisobutyrate dehydrogenase-like beta-hydroxyacid dehydrogenase